MMRYLNFQLYPTESCSAGEYMTDDHECEQCPQGTWSEEGASACNDCPRGKTSDAGSTSEDACYDGQYFLSIYSLIVISYLGHSNGYWVTTSILPANCVDPKNFPRPVYSLSFSSYVHA